MKRFSYDQLKGYGNDILDIFLPNMCLMCKIKSPLCVCKSCVHLNFKLNLMSLLAKSPLAACYALAPYEGVFKQCFHLLKFEGRRDIASFLHNQIVQSNILDAFQNDYMVLSVPSFWLNKLSRGYNPVELLFEKWIKEPGILIRKKWGLPSYLIGKKQREQQLKKAFEIVDVNTIQGKKVLLCDDLVTSQATLSRLAELLLSAGANEVIGLGLLAQAE